MGFLALTLPVNWSKVRMVSTAMGVPSRPTSRLVLSKLVMSQTTGPRWKMTGSSSGLVETAETYSVGAQLGENNSKDDFICKM